MEPRILPKRRLLFVSLAGLVVCLIILVTLLAGFSSAKVNLSFEKQTQNASAAFGENEIPSPQQGRIGKPARLKIAAINIDSAIVYVGLNSAGDMDAPKNPSDIAWFDLGVRPGENGSAVISGHYGWKDGIPAAFDNLHKLVRGDKIQIEDEKGAVTTFIVRKLETYSDKDSAPEVFSLNDGKAHLNLITCGGVWNKKAKSYSNRVVVFSDKEE